MVSTQKIILEVGEGKELVPDEVFRFDPARYEDEVVERWGREAYEKGQQWWSSLTEAEKKAFQQRQSDIESDFGRAHGDGLLPGSDEVQRITRRHYEWVTTGWQGRRPTAAQFTGLGQMYLDDPRFTAKYDRHGEGTAAFARDAMTVYAERNL